MGSVQPRPTAGEPSAWLFYASEAAQGRQDTGPPRFQSSYAAGRGAQEPTAGEEDQGEAGLTQPTVWAVVFPRKMPKGPATMLRRRWSRAANFAAYRDAAARLVALLGSL